MQKIIKKCPTCNNTLKISVLQCPECGLELKNSFSLSEFDKLDSEQYDFLIMFLKERGSLKALQDKLNLSYPTVKKKLDDLLIALNLSEPENILPETVDISNLTVNTESKKASEIIKGKLKENSGHVTLYSLIGKPCEIYAEPDGKSFMSDKLPIKPPYKYEVFDVIVDLLLKHGGTARKGNGRNFRLGEHNCTEDTVVGAVAKYRGNKTGDSVFDPVFVLVAVLEWAGIVINTRGEIILTEEYKQSLM